MKKFYESPAVEFTGFNAEDVITTSIVDTLSMDQAAADTFKTRITEAGVADTVVSYGSYEW